jgi:hypothetical protein
MYTGTLLLGLSFLVITGIRRKYPPVTWAVISASVLVLFVSGLKLFSYPPGDWGSIFLGSHQDVTNIKYVPGGILMIALGIPLIKRFLKFREPVFDDFVLFLPVLQITQRMGCFFNGCCHGTTTSLPWAVHYSEPSALFYRHYDQGLLEAGRMHSLGVHPTQLYTIAISLVILVVLIRLRHAFRKPGSFTLFALMLLGGMRFLLEFLREPLSGTWSATQWQFLNLLQWGILVAIIISGIVLWRRERKPGSESAVQQVYGDQLQRSMGIALLLIFLIWQIREIFERLEFLMLISVLTISLAIAVVVFIRTITVPQARWISASMLFAAFFTMGQSVENVAGDTITQKYRGWFSIGPSGALGAYDQIHTDCSGNVTGRTQRNYSLWGVTASYHYMLRSDRYLEAVLRQSVINERISDDNREGSRYLYISPILRYDSKKFGISVGPTLEYFWPNAAQKDDPNFWYSRKPTIIPSTYLRFGNRNKLFFDLDIYNRLHYQGYNSIWQIGIGHGFGNNDFSSGRFGLTADAGGRGGIYFGGDFLIKNQFSLSPYFTYVSHPGISLNLKWHIGKNKWKAANEFTSGTVFTE